MQVSRVIRSLECSTRPSRRLVSSVCRLSVGRSTRSHHVTRTLNRTSPTLQTRLAIHLDPENPTVVNQEEEPEAKSEENGAEKSEEEVTAKDSGEYSGPGKELLDKLRSTEAEGIAELIPDLEKQLMELSAVKSETEQKLSSMETELEESKAKYLRLSADFDNFRKRADSERDKLKTVTKGDIIEQLLPLIDNFELARTQIKPQSEAEEKIVNSFMGLYKQMVDVFSQLGVEAIDCDQKPFDPEFHDAIMREQNDDLPDGTVIEELRKGFTIGGKLLRPAMVKVSYSEEVLQDTELAPEDEQESEEEKVEGSE